MPTGVIDWAVEKPLLRQELGADFEAILKKLQLGYQATADGAKAADAAKPALTMGQTQPPAWFANLEKDLGSTWAAGPAKGQVLAPNAAGKWGFTTGTALMGNSVVMGAGALLGPVEAPINGLWNKLPLGSIAVGGLSAMALGMAIDDLYPHTGTGTAVVLNKTNLAIKGGVALALTMFGTKIFSSTGTLIAAAVLGLQVIADIAHEPLDKFVAWVVKMWNKLTGKTTTAGNFYQVQANQGTERERPVPAGAGVGAFD
jgi:hypothetical protein